jgi:hypothetical protein
MTTAQVVFANNAATVLASTLPATGITVELAPGTGILFPQLTVAGEFFMATLISQSNSLIRELVQVTAISGDTIVSMIRAQEGTSAISWVSGDLFQLNITAGSLAALQTAASAGSIPIAQVGAPNGVAPLDGDALVPIVNIPVSGLSALLGQPVSANGTDASGAPPALANILGSFTVTQPGAYFVQNQSAATLQVIFDNGSGGDVSVQLLAAGGNAGSQGADTTPPMPFYIGRVQIAGPAGSQYLARHN